MPKEYIEREAILDKFKKMPASATRDYIKESINSTPAAEVEPVVHGEWTKKIVTEWSEILEEDIKIELLVCSVCDTPMGYPAKRCPECGTPTEQKAATEPKGELMYPYISLSALEFNPVQRSQIEEAAKIYGPIGSLEYAIAIQAFVTLAKKDANWFTSDWRKALTGESAAREDTSAEHIPSMEEYAAGLVQGMVDVLVPNHAPLHDYARTEIKPKGEPHD